MTDFKTEILKLNLKYLISKLRQILGDKSTDISTEEDPYKEEMGLCGGHHITIKNKTYKVGGTGKNNDNT